MTAHDDVQVPSAAARLSQPGKVLADFKLFRLGGRQQQRLAAMHGGREEDTQDARRQTDASVQVPTEHFLRSIGLAMRGGCVEDTQDARRQTDAQASV